MVSCNLAIIILAIIVYIIINISINPTLCFVIIFLLYSQWRKVLKDLIVFMRTQYFDRSILYGLNI